MKGSEDTNSGRREELLIHHLVIGKEDPIEGKAFRAQVPAVTRE